MSKTIELPVWFVVLAVIVMGLVILERVLMPSARWFLRRRMERLVARINTHMARPIEPFRLMARQDRIVQLTYDSKVMAAAAEYAAATGQPEPVALEKARRYAREIVPGFSALVYFGFATRAAKWLSGMFYTVHVGKVDEALQHIDREATVIFVMNHRSNMDYVLVTWLVANRSALSYAVGEWARIWPLSALIRAMGAYFIRRGSSTGLYRRVLSRYVQMITAEGVTQAIFPEGGLSLDGRVGAAKVGLLSYILQDFTPAHRDVVFVPVGIGYDRVIEDRVLTEAARSGVRRFRAGPLEIMGFISRMIGRKLRGKYAGFGTAAVSFGKPVSLRAWPGGRAPDPQALGSMLMEEVKEIVPLMPVSLVAHIVRTGPFSRQALAEQGAALAQTLRAQGAVVELPVQNPLHPLDDPIKVIDKAITALLVRGIIAEGDICRIVAGKEELCAFQAAPVEQYLARFQKQPET